MGFLVALLAAFGYGLLELAFFAHRNQLLPWEGSHLGLGLLFAVMHLAVALLALGAARAAVSILPFLGRSWPLFVPTAALVAVHAVSFFRERYYGLPRNVTGTLATLGLFVLPFAVAWVLARLLPDRARASRVAVLLAAGVLGWGIASVARVRPMGEEETTLPRAASHRLEVRETGQRVLVFGFDGATWDILDPLIAEGAMPNLAALVARGRTFDLQTIRPTFSPVIWTSVATGKTRFRHGIHDVIQTQLPSGTWLHRSIERTAFFTKTTGVPFRALDQRHLLAMRPYRSGQIRSTSVFEAASEAGLPTSCLEWYVSWPAVPLSGVTVSDRFHLQVAEEGPMPGAVHPEALGTHLLEQVAAEVQVSRVLDFIDARGLEGEAAEEWVDENHAFVEEMQLNLARDLSTRNVAVELLSRDEDWRLFGVYFRAVDLTHHLTWRLRDGAGDPAADPATDPDARFAPVIRRYHEFMDGIVGDVLARVPEDAVILMLSDHGFEDRYAHSQAPDGFAILAGGPTVATPERGRLGIYDVAPTVAALLGLPVAQDLDGIPRTDLLAPAFLEAHPVRAISTWEREGREQAEAGSDAAVDQAEIERLRALGYIQ